MPHTPSDDTAQLHFSPDADHQWTSLFLQLLQICRSHQPVKLLHGLQAAAETDSEKPETIDDAESLAGSSSLEASVPTPRGLQSAVSPQKVEHKLPGTDAKVTATSTDEVASNAETSSSLTGLHAQPEQQAPGLYASIEIHSLSESRRKQFIIAQADSLDNGNNAAEMAQLEMPRNHYRGRNHYKRSHKRSHRQ